MTTRRNIARIRVMGVDPGSIATGFGVVERGPQEIRHVISGVLRPRAGRPFAERLYEIFLGLRAVIQQHRPDAMCLEKTYLGASVSTAIRLGEARATALIAAAEAGMALFEYPPSQVKLAIAGHGRAGKQEVETMVRRTLQLNDTLKLASDAADALALALCHIYLSRMPSNSARHAKLAYARS